MPLPWKNAKPNPISRIVSDLQPPSLLLQTGFPTSVVDLFVRNRHRIKRHSLKKTNHEHCPLQAPPPTPSLTPHNSPRLPAHSVDALQQESMAARVEFNVLCGRPNANSYSTSTLFLVAAKMFLAVIPVLSTKKLVLGITLSAFLLFHLEIFGKFAARFFNPSSIRNRFFGRRDGLIDHGGGGEEDPPMNSACNNEIQIVESNSDNEESGFDEGLQHEPFRNWEKRLGCCCDSDLEVEKEEQGKLQAGKNERSRSAKIIKKLIPKKLLSGKRWKKEMKEARGNMIIGNEQGTERRCEEEDEETGSSMMGKGEEDEEARKKNLECKFVMLMILSGLCGGRFVALVLTLSACFIFKLINILHHKCKFG